MDPKTVAALIESCRENGDPKILRSLIRDAGHGPFVRDLCTLAATLPAQVYQEAAFREEVLAFLLTARAHDEAADVLGDHGAPADEMVRARLALIAGRGGEAEAAYRRGVVGDPSLADADLEARISQMTDGQSNVVPFPSRS